MKKVLLISMSIIIILIIGGLSFYFWALSPVSKNEETQIFTIEAGMSKTNIAKKLKQQGLIRNDLALDIYMFFHGQMNIQAGEYELSYNMSPKEMLNKFENGIIYINSSKIVLLEGLRITDYAQTLSKELNFTQDDFLEAINDLEFIKTLVDEYWFLTDRILDNQLYYSLEGYLFPDTYEFKVDLTAKEVIKIILDHTNSVLEPLKEQLESSSFSIHDIMTMASIVEKEANTLDSRKMVAQVFFSRLSSNWSLGSDVTAFYGAKMQMSKESETWDVLNGVNPYNTRLTDGSMNGKLPIGPICNPSLESIQATLAPADTQYYYFVADTCTGEIYFQVNAYEFESKVKELSLAGCM